MVGPRSLAASKGSWLGEAKVDWLQLWDAHVLRGFISEWGDEWCRQVLSRRPGARANVAPRHQMMTYPDPSPADSTLRSAGSVSNYEEPVGPCRLLHEPDASRACCGDASLATQRCFSKVTGKGVGSLAADEGKREAGKDRDGVEAGDDGDHDDESDVIYVGTVVGPCDGDADGTVGKTKRCMIPGCNCGRAGSSRLVGGSSSNTEGEGGQPAKGAARASEDQRARVLEAHPQSLEEGRSRCAPQEEGEHRAEAEADSSMSRQFRTPLKPGPPHANGGSKRRAEGTRSAQKIKFTDQEVALPASSFSAFARLLASFVWARPQNIIQRTLHGYPQELEIYCFLAAEATPALLPKTITSSKKLQELLDRYPGSFAREWSGRQTLAA